MGIKLCSYNIEWFAKLFDADNQFATSNDQDEQEEITARLQSIADVVQLVDADIYGITEAPNTTTSTGHRSTVAALENFANSFGLRVNKAMIGFPSAGSQEIALLYDPVES